MLYSTKHISLIHRLWQHEVESVWEVRAKWCMFQKSIKQLEILNYGCLSLGYSTGDKQCLFKDDGSFRNKDKSLSALKKNQLIKLLS